MLSSEQIQQSIASLKLQAKPGQKRSIIIAYAIVNEPQLNMRNIDGLSPADRTIVSQVLKAIQLKLTPEKAKSCQQH